MQLWILQYHLRWKTIQLWMFQYHLLWKTMQLWTFLVEVRVLKGLGDSKNTTFYLLWEKENKMTKDGKKIENCEKDYN